MIHTAATKEFYQSKLDSTTDQIIKDKLKVVIEHYGAAKAEKAHFDTLMYIAGLVTPTPQSQLDLLEDNSKHLIE